MNKFSQLIIRYHGVFAFFILELIALNFYFSQNATPEKTAFLSSANRLVGGIFDYQNRWSRYWNLSAVNDSLAQENARLKMQLPSTTFSHLLDSATVGAEDSLSEQQYHYLAATVVNNSVHQQKNYLTLNRGSKHGVRKNTAVLANTQEGVVGVIRAVSTHYALVMSILNTDSRISSRIGRNNYLGVLRWDGQDPRYMQLHDIPKHLGLQKGDSVLTSGFSTVFPKDIFLGKIDSFYIEPGSNFYNISVQLVNDLGKADKVYIVDNILRDEQLELEASIHEQ